MKPLVSTILTTILLLLSGLSLADEFSENVSDKFRHPGVVGTVRDIVYYDDKVVVAGELKRAGPTPVRNIALWDLGTKTYHDMAGGLENHVKDLLVFGDGVVALMDRVTFPETLPQVVAYWDGHGWEELGDGLIVEANSLGVLDGQLYAGGCKWDGSQWQSVLVTDAWIGPLLSWQGMLVVGGNFTEINGVHAPGIAAWDGTQIHTLGQSLDGWVSHLTDVEGNLVAGGNFEVVEPQGIYSLASWDGSQWQDMGYSSSSHYFGTSIKALGSFRGRLIVGQYSTNFGGNIYWGQMQDENGEWEFLEGSRYKDLRAFCEYPRGLLIGGKFGGLGDVGSANLIRLNQDYQTLEYHPGLGVYGEILSACLFDDQLVVGGGLDAAGLGTHSKVTSFDGLAWAEMDSVAWGYSIEPLHPASLVTKLVSQGESLAARMSIYDGSFLEWDNGFWSPDENHWLIDDSNLALVGGHNGYFLGYDQSTVFRRPYNNETWSPWATVTGGSVSCFENVQGALVIGGSFGFINGTAFNHVASYSGYSWHSMGQGLPGIVACIGGGEDGVAVAYETESGDYQVSRYEDGAWFNLGSPFNDEIHALIQYGDHLYAAGDFDLAGDVEAEFLVWWTGDEWRSYGSGVQGSSFWSGINDMILFQDQLYLLGDFQSVAGVASDNIACLENPLPSSPPVNISGAHGRSHLNCSNHPNPFNPATEIRFLLPSPGKTRLDLFDLRGRMIKVLCDENLQAGEHQRRWDGNDTAGRPMSSGLYMVRLTGPDGTLTTKITLAR